MPDGATLIMGVLNTTPDSFSDGGQWAGTDDAIARGLALVADGAHIVDVGGESTRPGAQRVSAVEEAKRVLPVVRELAARGIRVSIDTMRAETAARAVDAGATIINDVSAGLADREMADAAAGTEATYIAMHWRAHSTTMHEHARYDDVVVDVRAELAERVHALETAGVPRDRLVIDPGLGFAKNAEHNWALLNGLARLKELGLPVLVGASRKRFLGAMLAEEAPPSARDLPSAVVSVLSAQAGVWAVRVHDVAATRVALSVLSSWRRPAWQSGDRD